jgi:hypothetical protein
MKILTITVLALIVWIVPAHSANERMYMGFSADSILSSCAAPDRSDMSLGFCVGFIYAIAYDTSMKGKSCAFVPVSFDPVVQEAIHALEKQREENKSASRAERLNTHAWPIIEAALITKWPAPCQ